MRRELLLESGIKPEELDKVLNCKFDGVWLIYKEISDNEYTKLLRIWSLLEPECWAYYKLTSAFYLAEWKLLEQAKKELRTAWRRIYRAFVAETKIANSRTETSGNPISSPNIDKAIN